MTPTVFRAFVKHASVQDVPEDYGEVRAAVFQMFPKLSSLGVAGLEAGGLGILAVPSVKTLRDPHASIKERSHAKWELAGLGTLAAHPAYEIGKGLLNKTRPIAQAARVL